MAHFVTQNTSQCHGRVVLYSYKAGTERMNEMSDRVKVAILVTVVIVINVILWKCGLPTRWEITQSIFGH